MNSTVTVKIKHCIWRDGRPRFVPGPNIRALGFAGRDLRHDDATWFSLAETETWCNDICAEITAARAGLPKPAPARRAPQVYVTAQMIADGLALAGRAINDGRKRRKPLAPKTLHWYRQMAVVIETDHPLIWVAPAAALKPAVIEAMLDRIEVKRGLATARGCRAVLSTTWQRMRKSKGLPVNPMRGLDLPTLEPRLRYGSIAEMTTLIAAADALGRPEIGDSIMLGLMTGQRQGDRLTLLQGTEGDGEYTFRQAKAAAIVTVPATPQLIARLAAMRLRRKDWRINYQNVILDEKQRRPFNQRHYGRLFAQVRTEAARTMPGLADFHDQDLRDTAVTWLALADCKIHQICSVTGHQFQSAHNILKHYLALHPDMARTAIGKLVTWLDAKGAEL